MRDKKLLIIISIAILFGLFLSFKTYELDADKYRRTIKLGPVSTKQILEPSVFDDAVICAAIVTENSYKVKGWPFLVQDSKSTDVCNFFGIDDSKTFIGSFVANVVSLALGTIVLCVIFKKLRSNS